MTFSLALGLAAGIAFFTALMHATVGGRGLLPPLLAAPVAREVRHTMEVLWHMLTFHLAMLGVSFAWAAARPDSPAAPVLAVFGGVTALGYAVLFFSLSLARFGNPLRMPPWTLALPMGALATAGPWIAQARAPHPGDLAAVIAALVLLALSLLHVIWAAGNPWPLRDRTALALTVVGQTGGGMPNRAATVAVAVLLAAAAGWVLSLRGLLLPEASEGFARHAITWGLVAVFALRGLGGFFESALRPAIIGTPYQRWSLRLYSPLSAALAAAVTLAAV